MKGGAQFKRQPIPKSPVFRQIIESGRNYAPTEFFKVC